MENDEAIDRIAARVRVLMSEDFVHLSARIEYLTMLIIQDRALAVHRRNVRELEITRAAAIGDVAKQEHIDKAYQLLDREINKFLGAIRETDDPERVYQEYLGTIRKEGGRLKLQNLVREHDELPQPHTDLQT